MTTTDNSSPKRALVFHDIQMKVPSPVRDPTNSAAASTTKEVPVASRSPLKTLGSAAGSATVRKTWRRDAPALRATSR